MTDDVLTLIADRLADTDHGDWKVVGDRVEGPGTLAIVLGDATAHGESVGHLDLGFVLNRERPDAPVLWDCTTGPGEDRMTALAHAVHIWVQTTVPAVRELLANDGSFADHYPPGDPDGFGDYHAIHGSLIGWGVEDGSDVLQAWWLSSPLLPVLHRAILRVDHPLSGMKIFFGSLGDGGSVAEVRVNGQRHDAASDALLAMDWPRPATVGVVRSYVVLVAHED